MRSIRLFARFLRERVRFLFAAQTVEVSIEQDRADRCEQNAAVEERGECVRQLHEELVRRHRNHPHTDTDRNATA